MSVRLNKYSQYEVFNPDTGRIYLTTSNLEEALVISNEIFMVRYLKEHPKYNLNEAQTLKIQNREKWLKEKEM